MRSIEAKEKIGHEWVPLTIPELFSDQIKELKTYVGRDVVVKIQTEDGVIHYFCGNDETMKMMTKNYPHLIHIKADSAYELIEHFPEQMATMLNVFKSDPQAK